MGHVNPFALLNDEKKQVKRLILDQLLDKYTHWAFHPMDNTATIEIQKEHFFKFLNHHKIEYVTLDLTVAKEEVKKEEKKEDKKKE